MANLRKTTTRKTGPYTRSRVTLSSRGVTYSNSFKAPGSNTRRTVSNHNGKQRVTYTTNHGNGWSSTSSKTTTLIGKFKPAKGRRSRSRSSSGGSLGLLDWFIIGLVLYGIYLLFLS